MLPQPAEQARMQAIHLRLFDGVKQAKLSVAMRVVMPLFQFQLTNPHQPEFVFSDERLAIRRFNEAEHLSDREIFSKRDRAYIDQARWALVVEANDLSQYKLDVNMLLMTFRILGDHLTPTIKYRLFDDDDLCDRLEETEMHIRLPGYKYEVYSSEDFPRIDEVYMMLRQAEHSCVRLKNAFYSLYRAFNSYHWIDSYLFYMMTLEALFSLDNKGPATQTICDRVSKLLKSPKKWSPQRIRDLYDVRSRIAHGRLEARPKSIANLRLLKKMERLIKLCFRKLIAKKSFPHFATPSLRDHFLAQL